VSASGNTGPGEKKYAIIEEMPQFPGGENAMMLWIFNNVKYPGEAAKNKTQGQVNVTFTVSSTGVVQSVKVTKPVDPLLDAEAVRVIESMPVWKPGTQHGQPVAVEFTVPIDFKLK
jgi:protein TonB